MKDNPELLSLMINDLETQKGIYRAGPYWQGYCVRIVEAINKYGIKNFRSNHSISKGYADSVALDPSTQLGGGSWKSKLLAKVINIPIIKEKIFSPYLKYINFHYNKMKEYRSYYYKKKFGKWLLQYNLPDTLAGGCQEWVDIAGKKIAVNYITHLARIHNFSKHIDFNKLETVFEIGGGYGANIHLLLHLYPNIRKVLYLDIPPVLYIATQYLKQFYNVKDYTVTRDAVEISFEENKKIEIIAICPWQIEKVNVKCDLFWNSVSFQEMEVDIIENYIDQIYRLSSDDISLCLVGQRTLRTHPNIDFLTMFENYFFIEEIARTIDIENPITHYLGCHKSKVGLRFGRS